jgi:hypothetical protein
MSRKRVLTLLVLTLLVLSGVRAAPKKQKALPPMPDNDHEELLAMTVADL